MKCQDYFTEVYHFIFSLAQNFLLHFIRNLIICVILVQNLISLSYSYKTFSRANIHKRDQDQVELKFSINSCKLELIFGSNWAWSLLWVRAQEYRTFTHFTHINLFPCNIKSLISPPTCMCSAVILCLSFILFHMVFASISPVSESSESCKDWLFIITHRFQHILLLI